MVSSVLIVSAGSYVCLSIRVFFSNQPNLLFLSSGMVQSEPPLENGCFEAPGNIINDCADLTEVLVTFAHMKSHLCIPFLKYCIQVLLADNSRIRLFQSTILSATHLQEVITKFFEESSRETMFPVQTAVIGVLAVT